MPLAIATARRSLALAVKISLVLALVAAIFATSRFRCWGADCTCTPSVVETYTHPFSRSGRLAVNAATGLLYSSIDDAMEFGVFDVGDVTRGPLVHVPTEGYISGIAIDEAANKLYASHGFSKSVRVVDGATHEHHDITVPDVTNALGPVVVDSTRHRLYVVRNDDFNIAAFDTVSETYVGAVGKGCCTSPSIRIALDQTNGRLFVLDQENRLLSVFDADGGPVAKLEVDAVSPSFAVDGDLRRAFLVQDEPQRLAVVDIDQASPTAFEFVAEIPLRDRPSELALDPTAHVGYVANNATDTLSFVDLAANRWIMDVPVGRQPSHVAIDRATARLYVALGGQGIAIVQGCGPSRRGLDGLLRSWTGPTPRPVPRVIATPVEGSDPTEAAARRDYVRCERMFRIRTNCVEGATTREAALAMAQIEASGARAVDGGAAGQLCGVAPDDIEPDLGAAGYYYSVPVAEPGREAPTVWTYAAATRTMLSEARPAALRVTRVATSPTTPWREALWWLSRCKTKALGEACCR